MPSSQKTFRIFVSSTFSDLKAERNALQEKVFPELQKLCEANGCRFQAVDLRWGVSEEAALDQQTMNICLTELKRCQEVSPRPNFIILLGDRYGWIPLPPQIDATEFEVIRSHTSDQEKELLEKWYMLDTNAVPPEYVLRPRREEMFEEADYNSWGKTEERLRGIFLDAINRSGWPKNDRRRIQYECSATHQEIVEGALKLPDEREHVFAFIRNIKNLNELPPDSEYIDEGVDKARALKDMISGIPGITSLSYDVTWNGQELTSHLEKFTADALDSLRRIIEEEFRQLEQIDDLTRENIAHEEFGAERRKHFVGRQKILDDIADYIHGDRQYPLVVYGPSGTGKSALMAKGVLDSAGISSQAHIIQRFIGATPESTDIRSLLEKLVQEITRAYGGDTGTLPTEYKDLKEELPKRLQLATKEKPLIIFLDALDQFSTSDNAHSLNWLPSTLPSNVKIVISVLEREDNAGECLRSARSKVPESPMLRLEDMTIEEGEQALRKWLLEAYPAKKRKLTVNQMESVLSGFRGCPKPLYLKLAFEEARRWKSYDSVPGLAGDVPGVVDDMLARLKDKKQHGEVLVKTFLGLLSAARHGLSETEILELLSEDGAVMADLKARSARSPEATGIPMVVWLRQYHDLAPYLMERSANNTVLFNFYHRQVGATVKQNYIHPDYHIRLAHYFRRKADPAADSSWTGNYVHGLAELPFQQTESGMMWDDLEATLTDLYFIDAKCKSGMVYDLVADYNRAKHALPEGQEVARNKEKRQEIIRDYVDDLIAYKQPNTPQTIEWKTERTVLEQRRDWTRMEKMNAWKHFVVGNRQWLTQELPLAFQLAYNSARNGPVVEKMQLQDLPSLSWFRLENRHVYNPYPACEAVLGEHNNLLLSLCMSLDGLRAVSVSNDVRIWDLETSESFQILREHRQPIQTVNMTPDTTTAVIGTANGKVMIVNTLNGEIDSTVQLGDPVTAVALHPVGKVCLIGSHYGEVYLWYADCGQPELLDILPKRLIAVGLPPGPERCAVLISIDGVRIFDLWSRRHISTWITQENITAAAITPECDTITFGCKDRTLWVWNVITMKHPEMFGKHHLGCRAIAVTPDGRKVMSGGDDRCIRLWDLTTGECKKTFLAHTVSVSAVAINADGTRGLSGGERVLKSWDLKNGEQIIVEPRQHDGHVYEVAISLHDGRAMSGGSGGSLRLWDLSSCDCIGVPKEESFPDSGLSQNLKAVFDQLRSSWQGTVDIREIRALSSVPNRHAFISGGADKTLRQWNAKSGKLERMISGHSGDISAVHLTSDGRIALSVDNSDLRVWDFDDDSGATINCPEIIVTKMSPDGRFAVSGGWKGDVRFWDLANCKGYVVTSHTSSVRAITITPDGRRIISGSKDGSIHLSSLHSRDSVRLVNCHEAGVEVLEVSLDGALVFSGGWDCAIRLWGAEMGDPRGCLVAHSDAILNLNMLPNGKTLVSSDRDGELRSWQIETGKCMALHASSSAVLCQANASSLVVIGTAAGHVEFLSLMNMGSNGALATVCRRWIHEVVGKSGHWDSKLTVLCPWCGRLFTVSDRSIGQEIVCPIDDCYKPLKLNPFICDNSDWLK